MGPIIAQVRSGKERISRRRIVLTTVSECSTIDGMDAKRKRTAFQGYIQVYTGNGKGKTTAALGLALRAAGHGMRTYFGQFLKGRPTGEIEASKRLSPLLRIEQFGRKGFIKVTEGPGEPDIARARRGLQKCLAAMLSGEFRIVVLDEVNTAVYFNLLSEEEVLDFLARKPAGVEVVLTGRYAPASVIERADLVTEMREEKHYSNRDVRAREGIEK
jgi:cob(I)alamin adenosyltransferase